MNVQSESSVYLFCWGVFFHHFCSCKSIAVWGSGSHSSVMVHLFHGSCYGKTERRRGGRGGYVGSPAWLFSLSLTFPMWLCICVFDHVNPCLAPTPQSPCHRLTATHTSVPDRNWQPTLSHTPPPKWHAFFIPPLSSLPQPQIKNEIKTLGRQAGKQELTVCSTSLSNSSDWKGIWLAHYDEIAMFQPWTRNNCKCFLIRHTTLRNSTSKHKKERVKDRVSPAEGKANDEAKRGSVGSLFPLP